MAHKPVAKTEPEPPRGRSLSFLLLAWMVPVTLAAVLGTAGAAYLVARQVIIRDADRELHSRAEGAARQVQAFFAQRVNDLETIAQSPLFPDHYRNLEYGLKEETEVYRRQIAELLLGYSRRSPVYARLAYLDEKGRPTATVGDDAIVGTGNPADTDRSFQTLRNVPRGGRYFERLARVDWYPAPIARYGAPIHDAAGRFRGAVMLDCSLEPVHRLLRDLHARSPVRSRLIDGVTGRPWDGGGEGPGANRLAASAVVEGTPWSILSSVDRRDLLQGLDLMASATLLLCLVACSLMALVVVGFVRYANQPILRLAEAVRAYARGDMDVRVEEGGPREVAQLSAAFNQMAEDLRRRTNELVQRLRELASLKRMSDAVLHQLGPDAIGRTCLEAAVTGLRFERGALYWVDESTREIAGECVYGLESLEFSQEAVRRRRVPLDGDDLLARVVRDGEALSVEDASLDPRCAGLRGPLPESRAFCLAPIRGRDRILGVIAVDRPSTIEPVPPPMVRSLSLFCSAAGLALENARLIDGIIASEDRLRAAVENSPDPIVGLDAELRITLWNPRAEAVFGWRAKEAFGESLGRILEAADFSEMRGHALAGRPKVHAEAAGRSRDGRRLDLIVSWIELGMRDGQPRGWFICLQDVTERKRLEAHLKDAEKAATAGHLVASVSHELNNPLAIVVGYADFLSTLPLPGQAAEDLRDLRMAALRCRDIVQGLLAFARRSPEKPLRFSLNSVAEAVMTFSEYRFKKADGIELEASLARDALEIGGDFSRLQQVAINLVDNARDAVRGCVGPRVIRLRTRRADGRCVLEIEDTGPGVPERDRQRIFEALYTTKEPGRGTGLGLWICAQVVAEHGGTIRCEQGAEGGARFVVALPPCPEGLPALQDRRDYLPPPVPGRKVLVVDDDPEVLRLMLRLLDEDGLDTEVADDCDAAERLLRARRFDLVLADVELGARKGTEILRIATGLPNPPAVILVTGDVLNRPLMDELRRLDVPLISKPFLRMDFLRTVRRELAGTKLSRGS
ncbi:MAG: PAS domain S-box protein [Elusimicrobia bacterium]|nr:PAS domain S-box protein [Elusimicrobiota bacterium]